MIEYCLEYEGTADFVEVQINSIDLYFRCNDKRCRHVTCVNVNFAAGDTKFDKTDQCACTREFRMLGHSFDPLVFMLLGDFTPDRLSLTDQDVVWSGSSFGFKFPIRTTHEGSWTMDQMVFDKILPRCMGFRKRGITEEPEFVITPPPADDPSDDMGACESRCMKKMGEDDTWFWFDKSALHPKVVGLHVVVKPFYFQG